MVGEAGRGNGGVPVDGSMCVRERASCGREYVCVCDSIMWAQCVRESIMWAEYTGQWSGIR